MLEEKNYSEELKDKSIIKSKVWYDKKFAYLTYYIPVKNYNDNNEPQLISIVSNLSTFGMIPAEYTRQAGIDEVTDEKRNLLIELTFSLGNKD